MVTALAAGLRLSVPWEELNLAYETWWEDGYVDLVLSGYIASAIPAVGRRHVRPPGDRGRAQS